MKKSKKTKTQRAREEQKLNKKFHDELVAHAATEEKIEAIKKDFSDAEDKSILDKFTESVNKKEPIIELFDIKNIKLKANLSEEQRNALAILMSVYNKCVQIGEEYGVLFELKAIKNICDEFIEMSPSIGGQRAEQYVDAHKAQIQQFMNQMPPQGGGYGNYSPQMQNMRR